MSESAIAVVSCFGHEVDKPRCGSFTEFGWPSLLLDSVIETAQRDPALPRLSTGPLTQG